MNWIKAHDYEGMSQIGAESLFKVISENLSDRNTVRVGMATGNTMIRLYELLAGMLNNAGFGLSNLFTFNLDEYIDIDGKNVHSDHPLSYRKYMTEKFFALLDPMLGFKRENMFFPDAENPAKYDALINDIGGLDFQLLGIGFNGHIAFNEPIQTGEISVEHFARLPSHVVELDELTIKTNARLTAGNNYKMVPHRAVTMGMKSILKAKEIVLLACFPEQVVPLRAVKTGIVTPELPASFLLQHKNIEIIYTGDKIKL